MASLCRQPVGIGTNHKKRHVHRRVVRPEDVGDRVPHPAVSDLRAIDQNTAACSQLPRPGRPHLRVGLVDMGPGHVRLLLNREAKRRYDVHRAVLDLLTAVGPGLRVCDGFPDAPFGVVPRPEERERSQCRRRKHGVEVDEDRTGSRLVLSERLADVRLAGPGRSRNEREAARGVCGHTFGHRSAAHLWRIARENPDRPSDWTASTRPNIVGTDPRGVRDLLDQMEHPVVSLNHQRVDTSKLIWMPVFHRDRRMFAFNPSRTFVADKPVALKRRVSRFDGGE